MYSHVLVTLDGSPLSEAVIENAARLVDGTSARVTLLTVAPQPQPEGELQISRRQLLGASGTFENVALQETEIVRQGETVEQAIQRAQDEWTTYLEGHARALKDKGVDAACVIKFGDAVGEILDFIKDQSVDVVAMSTHGRTGLGRLFTGSVAESVVRRSKVPVLLIRPRDL